jgi:transposase InsO family protein
MNIHSKAKLTALSRAEMIHRIVQLRQPVAEVAAGFGVSVRTAFKWLARFRDEGLTGLNDRSSRPQCSPRTTHRFRVARVLALRRRKLPGFQIARAAKLSKATVCRLLRRHGLHRLSVLEPPPTIRRYERKHPGELIHFDIKKLARIERTGYRVTGDRQRDHLRGAGWEFLHIAIDDHSRIAFAALFPDETARSAIAFLHEALAFFQNLGVRAQRVSSDNGSAYRSYAMAAEVAQLGLKHRFTRPYSPKTNGKAERFIQTSLREWAYAHAYSHSIERSSRLSPFLHHYNWHRPHHSLNLLAPISRLRLPLNNLLSLHI